MTTDTALVAAVSSVIAALMGYACRYIEVRATLRKTQLDEHAGAIEAYDKLCDRLNARVDALTTRLEQSEQRLANTRDELDAAKSRIEELENQNASLQLELAKMRQALEVK